MSLLSRIFGKRDTGAPTTTASDQVPTPIEIARLAAAFGEVIERHSRFGLAAFDVCTLPAPKQRLEFVLMCGIGVVRDDDMAHGMAAALLSLADYQENVGKEPVTLMPDLSRSAASTGSVEAMANAMLEHDNRYKRFKPLIDADLVRLKSLVDKAFQLRRER